MKFFMAPNCRGRADTLKLQSKLSNSAAEQTGLRDYMASKVDCKCVGNKVGVAACELRSGYPAGTGIRKSCVRKPVRYRHAKISP